MKIIAIAAVPTLTIALAAPSEAQLINHKDLSLAAALTIATTAMETCKARGDRVSVTVVGRAGEVVVQLRGDDSAPHTIENSRRKAYTARTFRIPSSQFVERVKNNPTTGQVHLNGVIANSGGLPINVGDETIGAVAVSGSPTKDGAEGGLRDEACAKAGIDKAADQLK